MRYGLVSVHPFPAVPNSDRAFIDTSHNRLTESPLLSVKYEEVYLRAYDTVAEARAGLRKYFGFYNSRRTHQSLDRQTPDQVYFQTHGLREAA